MARFARVEFWQSRRNGRWYFHKRAANGKVTERGSGGAGGGGFASSQGCRRAIKREHPGVDIVRLDGPPTGRA